MAEKTANKPKAKAKRSRGFCVTINNYKKSDIKRLENIYDADPDCRYIIYGKEEGKSGTPHLQCYIYYTNKIAITAIRKRLSPWHVEAQKSKTNVAAYAYCMEDGDFVELGERPRQGHRTDLEVIKYDLIKGKSIKDVSKEYFSQWCQYSRQFDRFKAMHNPIKTKIISYDGNKLRQAIDAMREHFTNYRICSFFNMTELIYLRNSGQYDVIFVEAPRNGEHVNDLIDTSIEEYLDFIKPQPDYEDYLEELHKEMSEKNNLIHIQYAKDLQELQEKDPKEKNI